MGGTMTKQARWATAALALLVLLFVWRVSGILLPFVVAFVLAYILAPVVARLTRWGVPRGLAAVVPIVLAVGLLVGALVVGVPVLVEQVASFLARLPVYVMTLRHFALPEVLGNALGVVQKKLEVDTIVRSLTAAGAEGLSMGLGTLQKGLAGARAALDILLLTVMTPIVSYYVLADWPNITAKAMEQLPSRWRPGMKRYLREIDVKLSAYLRGVMTVCLLLGLYYASMLSLVGLELGWAIGLMTGVLAFLPVIGATIGLAFMMAVALVQYQMQAWEPYALLAAIFIVGQSLEGYVLTPWLVGNRVGLHPVWVMFALLSGGALGGVLGMLVALPTAVVLSVVLPDVMAVWRKTVA